MPPHTPTALKLLVPALLISLAAAAALGAFNSSSTPAPAALEEGASTGFDGAALPPSQEPPRNFTLTDQYGRAVSLSEFRGRVTVLAFVYSTCGPTCIVIAQQIR